MFNSSKVETKVCPVTQVIEKTITPDKVVEMYDKVREEEAKAVAKRYIFSDNILNGFILEKNETAFCTRRLHIGFTLNGKMIETEVALHDGVVLSKSDAFVYLRDEISKAVSNQICRDVLFNL